MANQLTAIKQDVFTLVESNVREYTERGELILPAGYSVGNAMKSAWLILQEAAANNRPVLETCTKASIINTLLSMLYQGLNPDKKQCYFIPYGGKLTLQRSYFGSMKVARMVDPTITDICYDVVYEDDVFEIEKRRGHTIVAAHRRKLANIDKNKIAAAYCSIFRQTDNTPTLLKEEKKNIKKGRREEGACAPAPLPDRDYLAAKYGNIVVEQYELKYRSWQQRRGFPGGISYPKIAEWLIADGVPQAAQSSIDMADVMEEIRRQYTEEQA